MSYYGDDRIDQAVQLYLLFAGAGEFVPPQPGRHDCEVIGDIVYLRNVNGLLARVRVRPDGSMRLLEITCDRNSRRAH